MGNCAAAATAGITLQEHRCRVLEREVENALPTITLHKCVQWHQHCLRYVPRALALEDIWE